MKQYSGGKLRLSNTVKTLHTLYKGVNCTFRVLVLLHYTSIVSAILD